MTGKKIGIAFLFLLLTLALPGKVWAADAALIRLEFGFQGYFRPAEPTPLSFELRSETARSGKLTVTLANRAEGGNEVSFSKNATLSPGGGDTHSFSVLPFQGSAPILRIDFDGELLFDSTREEDAERWNAKTLRPLQPNEFLVGLWLAEPLRLKAEQEDFCAKEKIFFCYPGNLKLPADADIFTCFDLILRDDATRWSETEKAQVEECELRGIPVLTQNPDADFPAQLSKRIGELPLRHNHQSVSELLYSRAFDRLQDESRQSAQNYHPHNRANLPADSFKTIILLCAALTAGQIILLLSRTGGKGHKTLLLHSALTLSCAGGVHFFALPDNSVRADSANLLRLVAEPGPKGVHCSAFEMERFNCLSSARGEDFTGSRALVGTPRGIFFSNRDKASFQWKHTQDGWTPEAIRIERMHLRLHAERAGGALGGTLAISRLEGKIRVENKTPLRVTQLYLLTGDEDGGKEFLLGDIGPDSAAELDIPAKPAFIDFKQPQPDAENSLRLGLWDFWDLQVRSRDRERDFLIGWISGPLQNQNAKEGDNYFLHRHFGSFFYVELPKE